MRVHPRFGIVGTLDAVCGQRNERTLSRPSRLTHALNSRLSQWLQLVKVGMDVADFTNKELLPITG